jgi:hypothetical protein
VELFDVAVRPFLLAPFVEEKAEFQEVPPGTDVDVFAQGPDGDDSLVFSVFRAEAEALIDGRKGIVDGNGSAVDLNIAAPLLDGAEDVLHQLRPAEPLRRRNDDFAPRRGKRRLSGSRGLGGRSPKQRGAFFRDGNVHVLIYGDMRWIRVLSSRLHRLEGLDPRPSRKTVTASHSAKSLRAGRTRREWFFPVCG